MGVPSLLRRPALADDVYEAVKAMLMDHDVPPGERVSIDGVARQLGVSPTPVREALARLEAEGLATKEALKGYRSAPLLTREQFEDLQRFRLLLEPWAARRAAERIDEAGARSLQAEMDTAAVPSGSDYDGYKNLTAHDRRLHTLVTAMSGSTQVQRAFERTHCHLHIFRLYFERTTGAETIAEHRRLVDAIVAGSGDDAEAAMHDHLDAAMRVRLGGRYEPAPTH